MRIQSKHEDRNHTAADQPEQIGDDGQKNNMNTVDTTRGVTNFLDGSVPSARMASICSVTFMEPSSLAIPEALRPATISPVMNSSQLPHHANRNQLSD